MADPRPRSSSFGKTDSPVTTPPASLVGFSERGVDKEAQATRKTSQSGMQRPSGSGEQSVRVPQTRMGMYISQNDADRIREAFKRNELDEGYESVSDFLYQAAMKEVRRLERKYNSGQPYEGLTRLKRGRSAR